MKLFSESTRIAIRVMCALIYHDMMLFKQQFKDALINMFIARTTAVLMYQHIMPIVGLKGFGAFIAISDLVQWGYFRLIGMITQLVMDMQDGQTISYYLTLPFPPSLVFVSIALSNSLKTMTTSIFLLPLIKIVLGSSLTFEYASWWRFVVIFIVIHLFYSFLGLFLTSITRRLDLFDNVWTRIMLPLWIIGGYMFPWKAAYIASPWIGYALLCNPLIYCLEGIRGSLLGYHNAIPFSVCFFMLVGFTLLCAHYALKNLKRRVDCL